MNNNPSFEEYFSEYCDSIEAFEVNPDGSYSYCGWSWDNYIDDIAMDITAYFDVSYMTVHDFINDPEKKLALETAPQLLMVKKMSELLDKLDTMNEHLSYLRTSLSSIDREGIVVYKNE